MPTALGNHERRWTAQACLPGGDLFGERPSSRSVLEFDAWVLRLQQRYHWLPAQLAVRYARAYGTRCCVMLDGCASLADLGSEIVPGLHETEAAYLVKYEWAATAADILWRRSKLGLHAGPDSEARLDAWLRSHRAALPASAPAPASPARCGHDPEA